jgi:hypothetical protein
MGSAQIREALHEYINPSLLLVTNFSYCWSPDQQSYSWSNGHLLGWFLDDSL